VRTIVPYLTALSEYLTTAISDHSGASPQEVNDAIQALVGLVAVLTVAILAIRGTYLIFRFLFHAAAGLLTAIAVLLFVVIGLLNR
jgi:ABC-type protease/lipase transport system fused ATPase/permease subunit